MSVFNCPNFPNELLANLSEFKENDEKRMQKTVDNDNFLSFATRIFGNWCDKVGKRNH